MWSRHFFGISIWQKNIARVAFFIALYRNEETVLKLCQTPYLVYIFRWNKMGICILKFEFHQEENIWLFDNTKHRQICCNNSLFLSFTVSAPCLTHVFPTDHNLTLILLYQFIAVPKTKIWSSAIMWKKKNIQPKIIFFFTSNANYRIEYWAKSKISGNFVISDETCIRRNDVYCRFSFTACTGSV